MNFKDFSIGLEFWCGDRRWRCTDVGSRVITAISLEQREIMQVDVDRLDPSKKIEAKYLSTDPRDLSGPPFAVAEVVFDEYDQEGCSLDAIN